MAAAEFDAEELTVLIWLGSARGYALTHGESSWSLISAETTDGRPAELRESSVLLER